MSWDFFGTKGHMHLTDRSMAIVMGRNKEPEPAVTPPPNLDHMKNFADAVRSRNWQSLHAEIEETALSTALCHFGNLSYRLGRELRFDPARNRFIGDTDADKLLTREYRKPYVFPEKV
jgi:hypothetical protein